MTLKAIFETNDYDGMSAYLDGTDTSDLAPYLFANYSTLINFFHCYSLTLCKDGEKNFIYLEKLLTCIEELHDVALTKFIWQFEGFQQLVCYAPIYDRGTLYTNKSIFRSLINKFCVNYDIDVLITAYDDLVKNQPNFLIKYLKHLFALNKAYCFDDITGFAITDCTAYPICLFCVLLMARVIQQCPNNQEAYATFMMGAQYIFLFLNAMIHNLSMININEYTQKMLNWLHMMIKSTIGQYVYTILLDYNRLQTYSDCNNFMLSMCDHFSYFHGDQLRAFEIDDFVIRVLDSSASAYIKYCYIKLAISHSLCRSKLYELHGGLKNFIMNDMYDLDIPRFVKIIQMSNIVCKFGEIFDNDMMLYIYSEMPTMEDYLTYAIQNLSLANMGVFNNKITCLLYDLSYLVNAVSFVLANFNNMDINRNSFLYNILHLLVVMITSLSHPLLCSPFIEVFTKKCILHIPVLFDACREIIIDETFACLIDELNESFDKLKQYETDMPEEYFDGLKLSRTNLHTTSKHENFIDAITCDLVINPLYLDMPYDVLIDFKTAFNIAKTKKNPYTRNSISLSSLLEYNNRLEIKEKITQLKQDLACCLAK